MSIQQLSALIRDETIWLTQKAMAELFGVQTPAISKHLKKFLSRENTTLLNKLLQFRCYYFCWYRVNSIQATQFRIWATNILKEYMIKGFAMNDDKVVKGLAGADKD